MSEKVKLPKDVCDALDELRNSGDSKEYAERFIDIEKYQIDSYTIIRALVLGYEPPHEEKCFKLVNHALNDFVVFNSTSKSLHTNCKLIMVARNWNFEDCSWHEDK